MPDSCAARLPQAASSQASRRRLRGWELRDIVRLASALGPSGAGTFRVHGVRVDLVQHAQTPEQEAMPGTQASATAARAGSRPSRRQEKRRQRSAARAAAHRSRAKTAQGACPEAVGVSGKSQQLPESDCASPASAGASAATEQCFGDMRAVRAKPALVPDARESPDARSPDRKRQTLDTHAIDSIASGAFETQVHQRRAFESRLAAYMSTTEEHQR